MKLDKKEIGKRLKSITKAGQWNLESFGELAFGTSKGTVSNWENEVIIPNKRRLRRIAKIGNKSIKWILQGGLDVDVL
ncbi:helix-turn-helix domain-containing protein [Cytobacillus praedii]|uniref:helix-turn-helix domain-containing protein n=1 Tax=Cytobacillus praedii TaxID=1742358 RepID=UPI003F7D3D48